jgi:hypothetical protein
MGPQQILQLVQCRENILHGIGRTVYFTNSNLSFPCNLDLVVDHEKRASAKGIILHTISQASATSHKSKKDSKGFQFICGDFNSNSEFQLLFWRHHLTTLTTVHRSLLSKCCQIMVVLSILVLLLVIILVKRSEQIINFFDWMKVNRMLCYFYWPRFIDVSPLPWVILAWRGHKYSMCRVIRL